MTLRPLYVVVWRGRPVTERRDNLIACDWRPIGGLGIHRQDHVSRSIGAQLSAPHPIEYQGQTRLALHATDSTPLPLDNARRDRAGRIGKGLCRLPIHIGTRSLTNP